MAKAVRLQPGLLHGPSQLVEICCARISGGSNREYREAIGSSPTSPRPHVLGLAPSTNGRGRRRSRGLAPRRSAPTRRLAVIRAWGGGAVGGGGGPWELAFVPASPGAIRTMAVVHAARPLSIQPERKLLPDARIGRVSLGH